MAHDKGPRHNGTAQKHWGKWAGDPWLKRKLFTFSFTSHSVDRPIRRRRSPQSALVLVAVRDRGSQALSRDSSAVGRPCLCGAEESRPACRPLSFWAVCASPVRRLGCRRGGSSGRQGPAAPRTLNRRSTLGETRGGAGGRGRLGPPLPLLASRTRSVGLTVHTPSTPLCSRITWNKNSVIREFGISL